MEISNKNWIGEIFEWADQNNIPDLYFVDGDKYHPGFWAGLPREKETLLNLEELDLSWHGVCEIPEQLRHLTKLKVLRFDKSRDGLTAPHWQLSRNECRIQKIPDWISELQNLEELSLMGNDISTVPAAVTKLLGLRLLYLNQNRITNFHGDMTALKALEVLWLDRNKFDSST